MNNHPNTTSRLLQQQQQSQQLENKTKKKKCRGQRKKQRLRRQLYDQGYTTQEVDKLVEVIFPSQKPPPTSQQQQQQQYNTQNLQVYIPLDRVTVPPDLNNNYDDDDDNDSMEIRVKRKRFILTPTPTSETTTILDQPLSQLTISSTAIEGKNHSKRTRTTTTTITTNEQCITENNELPSSMMTTTDNFKPSYLKVPDRIFKQMLANSIENGGSQIVQYLNTNEKLHFTRRMAEITNDLYFKDLQRQLWQEYHTISSKDDNQWHFKITKQYANQHNTCRMYKPQGSFIQQYQQKIQQQIEQIANQLQEYITMLHRNIEQWEPPFIDPNILSHAINEYVKKGQQRLKENFDYKKQMISLDWNDHQLITKFYKLKPSEEQTGLAKQIWQATANKLQTTQQIEILRQRIILKRLPSQTDKMINELLYDNQKTLSNPFLEQKERASFASRYSKTIIQSKFNLIIIEIDELETVMRHHRTTLINLQDKLSKLNKEKSHVYTTLLLDTIEQRRQAMIQRFFRIREYKLKTFFDEAPTVDNNIL